MYNVLCSLFYNRLTLKIGLVVRDGNLVGDREGGPSKVFEGVKSLTHFRLNYRYSMTYLSYAYILFLSSLFGVRCAGNLLYVNVYSFSIALTKM